jgi:Putative restriction endonuclease
MVGVPVIDTGPMTVEEFYAFTDTRPDEEKWELIDGEPILNAAPSRMHQWIIGNVIVALGIRERELKASWAVLPRLGVRVSDTSRPAPDVLVIPSEHRRPDGRRDRSDVIVAFEVLSPSTEGRDLRWKRTAYNQPSIAHPLHCNCAGRRRGDRLCPRRRFCGAAASIDRQGNRAALARNFIASGRDLSRHRAGVRSHSRSTIRQPSS